MRQMVLLTDRAQGGSSIKVVSNLTVSIPEPRYRYVTLCIQSKMLSSSLCWVTKERWPVEIFNKNNYSSLPLFSPEVSSLPLLLLKFHLHHNPLHLFLLYSKPKSH